jgi:glutamine synthetase
MMQEQFALANPIEQMTGKSRDELTRDDLIQIILDNRIERVTFHYTGIDGAIKELRIPVTSRKQIEVILAEGERADGSSLFKGVVDAGKSDLYVVPVYSSAFINPFDETSLDFVCRFITGDGELAPFAPDNLLTLTHQKFQKETGMELKALGELEFYLIGKVEENLYPIPNQKGYHGSSPYVKTTDVVNEMLSVMTNITSEIKYVHNEVGFMSEMKSDNPLLDGKLAEQVEMEFLPTRVDKAADVVVLGKWLCQSIAERYGLICTFYPKLEVGQAGSGLHFHTLLEKDGKNIMLNEKEELSEEALALIGGYCRYAPTLSAFGNMTPASFLRLVPHQEAPTMVCWSYSNRSALIRVPLGWRGVDNLAMAVNPQQKDKYTDAVSRQTAEIRSADGSANAHLLLAGITTAALWAFNNKEEALKLAEEFYVQGNIHDDEELCSRLVDIALSCEETGENLLRDRKFYEEDGIFPPLVVEKIAADLKAEGDRGLNRKLMDMPEEEAAKVAREIMHRDFVKF